MEEARLEPVSKIPQHDFHASQSAHAPEIFNGVFVARDQSAKHLQPSEEEQDLFEVTTRCLERLQPVLEQEKPDWVLVQGDTTTTRHFEGALIRFVDELSYRLGLGPMPPWEDALDRYLQARKAVTRI